MAKNSNKNKGILVSIESNLRGEDELDLLDFLKIFYFRIMASILIFPKTKRMIKCIK